MATHTLPTGLRSSVLDLITCDLCYEQYNDSNRLPKALPCLHMFCLECMIRYHGTHPKLQLKCPTCKESFNVPRGGMRNLRTSFMVRQLLDKAQDGQTSEVSKPDETDEGEACHIHQREKCDLYCMDCRISFCLDCMLEQDTHKQHAVLKKRDIEKYKSDFRDTSETFIEMQSGIKQRVEKLNRELMASRDTLFRQADGKLARAQWEAQVWHTTTTANISQNYHDLQLKLLKITSMADLQEFQIALEKLRTEKIGGVFKEAQSTLDSINAQILEFKNSCFGSPKSWATDMGEISEDLTVDLGHWTGPSVRLPDIHKFPFSMINVRTPDKSSTSLPAADVKFNTNQGLASLQRKDNKTSQISHRQDLRLPPIETSSTAASGQMTPTTSRSPRISSRIANSRFRLLFTSKLKTPCYSVLGLATKEAVVTYKDNTFIKRILLQNGNAVEQAHKNLPDTLSHKCKKFVLDNKHVLLRDYARGPSYILNESLDLVTKVEEDYGNIVAAESAHWVAFDKAGELRIHDLHEKKLLQTLRPPSGGTWWVPSVCRRPDGALIAVVDALRTLCIFDSSGRHVKTHLLRSVPSDVCCNERHVYVLSWNPVSLTVVTWRGQLVATLDEAELNVTQGQYLPNARAADDRVTVSVGTVCGDGSVYVQCFKTYKSMYM